MKKILMYLCAALAIVLCTSSVFAFSTGSYRVDAKNASYTWGERYNQHLQNGMGNRSSIYTPQTDDIDGVKYVYGY